jgi:hypothetical protein
MSSKKQQKKQRHAHKLSQDMQDALADIVLSQVDRFWRNHGEGFENTPQEGKILKAMLDNMHNNPDPDMEALAQEVWMSDLEVALQRAKHERSLRVPKAREWVTKSLPLWLNELRNGDIGQFPTKSYFVQHFRQPEYNFDRGIISDQELGDIFVEYQRSNFAEILRLNREAQNRETVMEATNEYMADVISKAVTGTALSEATNDVLHGAIRGAINLQAEENERVIAFREAANDALGEAIRGAINLQAEENETVLVATTEFLADVVGGAVEGTAISEATNDILHGAVRLATVFEGLPRWQERARRRALRGDMPNPHFWPEVAYDENWDPTGFQRY